MGAVSRPRWEEAPSLFVEVHFIDSATAVGCAITFLEAAVVCPCTCDNVALHHPPHTCQCHTVCEGLGTR